MTPQRVAPATPAWALALLDTGGLASGWEAIFAAVPRRLFLPDLMWPYDSGTGGYRTVDRRQDPTAWERWADADTALVVQWDDGDHSGAEPGTVATSSASQPVLVAQMLDDLDLQPGHRVLDIGVGTGWTTALLSARLGDQLVTGIELDPRVAELATRRLAAAGYRPTVITGDGAAGYEPAAPYDRIQVTYAGRIPPAWTKHTTTGPYVMATNRLARRRSLPRWLMPFLDDMHRLGLLRAVGPIYQFRHAELQDHLAATYREREQANGR